MKVTPGAAGPIDLRQSHTAAARGSETLPIDVKMSHAFRAVRDDAARNRPRVATERRWRALPMPQRNLTIEDFDYALPGELVAQAPAATRSASRLLHVDGERLSIGRFVDLVDLVAPGDVVVMNDTRVLRARVAGRKPSGGRVEMLVERIVGATRRGRSSRRATCLASAAPCSSTTARAPRCSSATADSSGCASTPTGDRRVARKARRAAAAAVHRASRRTPRMPSATRPSTRACPAPSPRPTAGFHFDLATLDALEAKGVRLAHGHAARGRRHVPAGARRQPRYAPHARRALHDPGDDGRHDRRGTGGGRARAGGRHHHAPRARGGGRRGRRSRGGRGDRLFIRPGFRFRVVDRLLTNFHLPRSTLMVLVAAFAGLATIRRAYEHAIETRYRFFSYGDAMLLEKATRPAD
jgi:S-adenosylmethionine:tRNA ribosyltransferase-isomerase